MAKGAVHVGSVHYHTFLQPPLGKHTARDQKISEAPASKPVTASRSAMSRYTMQYKAMGLSDPMRRTSCQIR